jgi:hypothetical protein
MDINFEATDKEMYNYLEALSSAKDYYFWKEAPKDFVDAVYQIKKDSVYFYNEYIKACQKTYDDGLQCRGNASITEAKEFLPTIKTTFEVPFNELKDLNIWKCNKLAIIKSNIFYGVAYDILYLNKAQIEKDTKKLYDQTIRTRFVKLTNMMSENGVYIDKIADKWPSKTSDTY